MTKARKSAIDLSDNQNDKERRLNNPPVEPVTPSTDIDSESKYDPHLDPQLIWSGNNFQPFTEDKQEEDLRPEPLQLGSRITKLQQIESIIGLGK